MGFEYHVGWAGFSEIRSIRHCRQFELINHASQIEPVGNGDAMVSQNTQDVARQAKRIYKEQLQASLEESHKNEFVAIEPVSGEYFLGRTLSEAIGAARREHPDRLAHAIRVGHKAAIHFGMRIR